MIRKPIVATPLTVGDMAEVLEKAFRALFGRDPTRSEASWLLGLARHENRNGEAIIQHNWGNRVPSRTDDYWVPSWADLEVPDDELSKRVLAVRKRMLAGKAVPKKFAAYKDHAQGARKYLSLFKSKTHARVLDAARKDDAEGFHRAIYTPSPLTGMAYCPDCGADAVGVQYAKLSDDSRKYYGHLSDPKELGEGGSSSLPLSPSPTSWQGVRFETLRRGMAGHPVLLLQWMLAVHQDGKFGPNTESKVKELQTASELISDGVVGPITWEVFIVSAVQS